MQMLLQLPVTQISTQLTIPIIEQKKEEKKERPLYVIKEGDNLTKIAEANGTSVERLWAANATLTDPNLIQAEKPLKIPEDAEVLAERPLPVIEVQPPSMNASPESNPVAVYHPPVAGNTYDYQSCTWHVKEMRPDIPNNWGNATDWMYNAQAQGWPTGSEPRAGAIGWRYGHVVYVEAVNPDGTILISERNYDWNNSYRQRAAEASEFTYIY